MLKFMLIYKDFQIWPSESEAILKKILLINMDFNTACTCTYCYPGRRFSE